MRLRDFIIGVCATLIVHAVAHSVLATQQTLLPTQQRVNPRGKEIDLGLFPAGIAISSDGRLILVSNNGFIMQSLTAIDTQTLKAADRRFGGTGSKVLFMGVVLDPDGRHGYASGHSLTGADVIHTVTIAPGPTVSIGADIQFPTGGFAAGLAISADGRLLYAAANLMDSLQVIDTQRRIVIGSVAVGKMPWGVARHPMLPQVYVTNRADNTVSIVDTETLSLIGTVATGRGPNAVAVSPDGGKVFVADATSDDLTVFDVDSPQSPRRISLQPFANALPGSSPSALAFSPDGSRLYAANAWDNDVAVVDPVEEAVVGLIPTGFYPSGIAVSPDNRRMYITNMKGARVYPRTKARQPLDFFVNTQLAGSYGVHGTLQVLPVPGADALGFSTRRVRFYNGFDTGIRPSNIRLGNGPCSPIPCNPGDPTPIKHVVFIVRENKTYDQELSDLPQGEGEPSLILYGADVTPNLHALVQEFVLLDRFFIDSEKSEPGHQWTTAAIDSDYIEKTWTHTAFDGRPNDIGVTDHGIRPLIPPVSQPAGGYWFDNCFAHNVTFRNYGEFWRTDDSGNPIDYWVNNTDTAFRPFDLDYADQLRFDEWRREFDQQVQTSTFPQFTYLWFPNDHTKGTGSGVPDPRSFVADNDLATAKVVEAISNSPFWEQTVIFVLEDDSQSGVDHIDSHRSIGTVIGPYVRRHYVSHTRFDMASMHRTMELILGLPPMSQFDQMAIPMRELFTDTPDTTPYTALPENFSYALTLPNPGAELSERQDWSGPDRVPDAVLNKLLWEYLKGVGRRAE